MLNIASRSGKSARNSYIYSTPAGTTARLFRGGKFFSALRWVTGLGLCTAVLVGLATGVSYIYRYATTCDFFTIRRIEVRGATHFQRDAVLNAAGLQPGLNSLTVNIADIEAALRKNPWVTSVAVKRRLPDAFEIHLVERVPAFWMLKDGQLQYVDDKAQVIAPVEAENFLSLPTLEILPGGELLQPQVESMVASLRNASLPLDMTSVSWVRLSAAKGFEVFLESRNLSLCIAPENWEENLNRLCAVLADLARRGELRTAREVWASEGSVWVVRGEGTV